MFGLRRNAFWNCNCASLATFVVFPFVYLYVDVCSFHGTFDHLCTQLSPCLTQNRCMVPVDTSRWRDFSRVLSVCVAVISQRNLGSFRWSLSSLSTVKTTSSPPLSFTFVRNREAENQPRPHPTYTCLLLQSLYRLSEMLGCMNLARMEGYAKRCKDFPKYLHFLREGRI